MVIERHGQHAALVIALSAVGVRNLRDSVAAVLASPSLDRQFPELRMIVELLSSLKVDR